MSNKVQIDKRSEKGNITLRLRWWFEGKREQLILGVREDKLGRSYAELVQKQIAHDLSIGIYTSKEISRKKSTHELGANQNIPLG